MCGLKTGRSAAVKADEEKKDRWQCKSPAGSTVSRCQRCHRTSLSMGKKWPGLLVLRRFLPTGLVNTGERAKKNGHGCFSSPQITDEGDEVTELLGVQSIHFPPSVHPDV